MVIPKKTTEYFIKEAKKIHGNRYDYSLVNYEKARATIKIICPIHGIFTQRTGSHLEGRGCNACGYINTRKSINQFIKEAKKIHGNNYNYSLVNYKNSATKIKIICLSHGIFKQRPNDHLKGNTCPKCRNIKRYKTQKQFIQNSVNIHKDKYDYSIVNYISNQFKVKIICPIHGVFTQRPADHIRGRGCLKCPKQISNPERQWLSHIGLPDDNEHRQVLLLMCNNKRRCVDGYDPITNTIYEFYGDYWHGNPSTTNHNNVNTNNGISFRQLYKDTLIKETLIKDSGYSLVTIWESDWKNIAISTIK